MTSVKSWLFHGVIKHCCSF